MNAIIARQRFYLVDRPVRTRREVEQRAPLVDVVCERPRAVMITDGTTKAWVPRSALRNTSEPDVMALTRWFRPKPDVRALFTLRDAAGVDDVTNSGAVSTA